MNQCPKCGRNFYRNYCGKCNIIIDKEKKDVNNDVYFTSFIPS